jgi:hypothetical protein
MFTRPTASGQYEHVYSGDPAIDTSDPNCNHEQWVETGDAMHLPLRVGCEPVRFTLRHLTSRDKAKLADVQRADGNETMAWWAVALALVRVAPLIVDGQARVLRHVIEGGRQRVADDDMDLLLGVDGLYGELALRVIKESYSPNPTGTRGPA